MKSLIEIVWCYTCNKRAYVDGTHTGHDVVIMIKNYE